MKFIYSIFCTFITLYCGYSQEFYINTVDNSQLINNAYVLNVLNNNQDPEIICQPTNNVEQYFENTYTDIAIDYLNNIYYVSAWGSLYRKNTNDSSCEFLGKFGDNLGTINSLVADSNVLLYASGNSNGVGVLYKYDINLGVFSELGSLPTNYIASGDLFFYEDRLFLTAQNITTSKYCIIEINMIQPEISCFYMDLNNLEALSAFSVNYGTFSKSYILTAWTDSNQFSSLIEIDIMNREIENNIRTYDYIIYGAAAHYNLTSTSSICDDLGVDDIDNSNLFLKFINPTSNKLIINTNIEVSAINEITILDIQGKKIKTFKNLKSNILDVSNIGTGLYIAKILIDKDLWLTKKIIIE